MSSVADSIQMLSIIIMLCVISVNLVNIKAVLNGIKNGLEKFSDGDMQCAIRVTDLSTDVPIVIDRNLIVAIEKSKNHDRANIYVLGCKEPFYVKESYQEIIEKCNVSNI